MTEIRHSEDHEHGDLSGQGDGDDGHAGSVVQVQDELTCRECGEAKAVDEFARQARARNGRDSLCKSCRNRQKRNAEKRGGPDPVDLAPDRRPAVRLRAELARRRAAGEGFEAAWGPSLDAALKGLKPKERATWNAALRSTRPSWRRGFEREGAGGSLTAALLVAA